MGEHDIWFDLVPAFKTLKANLAHAMGNTWVGGEPVHELNHVVLALIAFAIIMLVAVRYKSRVAASGDGGIVPESGFNARSFVELVGEGTLSMMTGIMGAGPARQYFPLIGTMAFFILVSNLLGQVPGFGAPTGNFNTTAACAIVIFVVVHVNGVRANGIAYFKHFLGPVWWLAPLMLPIEIFSHLVRPFSLAVRLMCNMFADHTLLLAFLALVPLVVPLPVMALGMLICIVQTAVFCLLSTVYIAMAIEHHEEGHAEAHAH
jgi:F-type H+-transporting ATPase subunit a